VTRRVALLDEVRADVLDRVVRVLEQRLDETTARAGASIDGVRTAAATLAGLEGDAGQEIVDALAPVDPDLSRRLRERLFAFETLRTLEAGRLRELSRTVDRGVFALALKGADPELQELLLGRLPEPVAEAIRGQMTAIAAPRLENIERAQRALVAEALRLEGGRVANLEEQFVDGR
jgi:flagellar motor switch protein FliG